MPVERLKENTYKIQSVQATSGSRIKHGISTTRSRNCNHSSAKCDCRFKKSETKETDYYQTNPILSLKMNEVGPFMAWCSFDIYVRIRNLPQLRYVMLMANH